MNFDQNQEVYIHDNQTGIYHSINTGEVVLPISNGDNNNRFTIRFKTNALGNDSFESNSNSFYHYNNEIILLQQLLEEEIKEIRVFNVLGQNTKTWTTTDIDSSSSRVTLPTKSFAKGVYIVNITTTKGKYSKKIIVE